jgi:hypothetical protein
VTDTEGVILVEPRCVDGGGIINQLATHGPRILMKSLYFEGFEVAHTTRFDQVWIIELYNERTYMMIHSQDTPSRSRVNFQPAETFERSETHLPHCLQ